MIEQKMKLLQANINKLLAENNNYKKELADLRMELARERNKVNGSKINKTKA